VRQNAKKQLKNTNLDLNRHTPFIQIFVDKIIKNFMEGKNITEIGLEQITINQKMTEEMHLQIMA
jgi:hypothetical protein